MDFIIGQVHTSSIFGCDCPLPYLPGITHFTWTAYTLGESMKILLLNWAKFADGASNGGGVNGYCRQLALALVERGHDVTWLSSGIAYDADHARDALNPCHIRRHENDSGVAIYEVVNSPVLAPGIFQFSDPWGEISAPELEREFLAFITHLQPEIIHFHNIEGFSSGCIDIATSWSRAQKHAAKVLFSLHNYHTVCPQVYLMQRGTQPCFDFDSGRACQSCTSSPPMDRERRIRAGLPLVPNPPIPLVQPALESHVSEPITPQEARSTTNPFPNPDPEPVALTLLKTIGKRVLGRHTALSHAEKLAQHPVHIPLPLINSPTPPSPPSPPSTPSHDGIATPIDLTRPLTNDCPPAPPVTHPTHPYALRRAGMIAALNRCDRVIAVSDFVKRKFESLGVHPEVLSHLPIGTRMVELATSNPARVHEHHQSAATLNSRPIRLAFMGYNNFYKGLHMFLDALDLLPPDILAKYHLFIWAKDIERDEARLNSFTSRLAGLDVHNAYQYEQIPSMLCGMDIGIVPSVWWDNGPQTVMEFLACNVPVLGANLGGIPDILRDGHNGLLFTGNDRRALASRLTHLVQYPEVLLNLRTRNLSCDILSMHNHLRTLEEFYITSLQSR